MTRCCRRVAATALVLVAAAAWAQSGTDDAAAEGEGDDLDALFDAEMIEDEAGNGAGDAAAADAGSGDLDALFDSEVVETAVTASDAAAGGAPEETLLTRAGVDWGGSFRYAPEVELGFPDYDALTAALRGETAAERALRHDLGAELYFDARPSSDFRAFGKAKVDYALPGMDGPGGSQAGATDTGGEFSFTVFELFADFHWDDRVFFRAGKQRADWGVGRFFSPADLMSLVTIDPLAPEAEREGPVALKVHAPLGVHNAYLYLVTGDFRDPLDVAVGARGELVVGGVELGAGGLVQADLVPKAIATATGSLGDFDLFAELVIQQGTERNLVELDAAGRLKVTSRDARGRRVVPGCHHRRPVLRRRARHRARRAVLFQSSRLPGQRRPGTRARRLAAARRSRRAGRRAAAGSGGPVVLRAPLRRRQRGLERHRRQRPQRLRVLAGQSERRLRGSCGPR